MISLANQFNENFTVYIGNDASPDDPSPLIAKYSSSLNIIYKKFEENVGSYSLVEHWARCILMINNEGWIMILGDDDVLDPNVVSSWYSKFAYFHSKTNLVRFATQFIDAVDGAVADVVFQPEWEKAQDAFYRKFEHKTRSSLSEYIFKKKSYEVFGFCDFQLAWHSDDRAWLDFSDHKPIYSINNSIVYVRLSEESISGRIDNLELKRTAGISFYKSLIRDKLNLFSKSQRIEILRKYETLEISFGLMNVWTWFFLFNYYIRNFNSRTFKGFLKRLMKFYF